MLVSMECKKQKKIKFLSLCRGQGPRPSTKKGPLPRAQAIALGKDFFGKNPDNFFAEGQGAGPRQRVKKNSKKPFLCRGPALGKEFFKNPENYFAEGQGGSPRQRF